MPPPGAKIRIVKSHPVLKGCQLGLGDKQAVVLPGAYEQAGGECVIAALGAPERGQSKVQTYRFGEEPHEGLGVAGGLGYRSYPLDQ